MEKEPRQSFKDIDARYDGAVDDVRKRQAFTYLHTFRHILKDLNLARHEIRISAGMGSACLWIQELNREEPADLWIEQLPNKISNYDRRRHASLLQPANKITMVEEALNYDWAYHLDNQILNRTVHTTRSGIKLKLYGHQPVLLDYADTVRLRADMALNSWSEFYRHRTDQKWGHARKLIEQAVGETMHWDRQHREQPAMEGLERQYLEHAVRRCLAADFSIPAPKKAAD